MGRHHLYVVCHQIRLPDCPDERRDARRLGAPHEPLGLDALCDVTGAESPPRPPVPFAVVARVHSWRGIDVRARIVREWHEHPGGWRSA